MGLNPFTGSNGNEAQLVDKMIGTAYKTVRNVAENIEYVKHVSAHMPAVFLLANSMDTIEALAGQVDVFDQLDPLLNNIDDVIAVVGNIADIVTVAGLAADISALPAQVTAVHADALAVANDKAATHADKLAADASAAAAAVSAADAAAIATGSLSGALSGAPLKTALVDADPFMIVDTEAGNTLAKTTWSAIKTRMKAFTDTLYATVGHVHTFASLTSKPTTLAGYGITDGISAGERAKLGNISVTGAVDLDDLKTKVLGLDQAIILKGTWDASAGTFPGAGVAQAGWTYIVSTGGTVNGQVFTNGDRIVAIVDNASTTTFAANWFKEDYTDAVLSVNGATGAVAIEALIHAATSKATPVDADEFGGTDSAASFGLRRFTWANIKATLVATGLSWSVNQSFNGGLTVNGSTGQAIGNAGGPANSSTLLYGHAASGAGNAAFITLDRPGSFAANFGIDTDNKWKVGGFSMGANAYELLHMGNITTLLDTRFQAIDPQLSSLIRQNLQNGFTYTLVLSDGGKHIYKPPSATGATTWTIPANSAVAFPVGTAITFDNDIGAGPTTIAITTDTLVLVGAAGSTGSRTLASGGQATAIKVSATRWRISGVGLT